MPRVIHFEIHAEKPERAIKFYSDLLGWQFNKWEGPMPYWLVITGPDGQPGINGGLIPRRGEIDGQAVIAYVCTVDVSNVDQFTQKAVAGGARWWCPKCPSPASDGWFIARTPKETSLV